MADVAFPPDHPEQPVRAIDLGEAAGANPGQTRP